MKNIRGFLIILCIFFILTISGCGTSQPDVNEVPPTNPLKTISISPTKTPSTNDSDSVSGQTIEADAEFNLLTANKVSPEDILSEIVYYGQGGGCYCRGKEQYPTITYEPFDEELMTLSTMIACGWQIEEILTGTIKYPNGRSITKPVITGTNEGAYFGKLEFKPSIEGVSGILCKWALYRPAIFKANS